MISIYCLINPLNNKLFYVGKTDGDLNNRLSNHLSACRELKTPTHIQIHSIVSNGLKPIIKLIKGDLRNEIREDWAAAIRVETFWINHYYQKGFLLKNIINLNKIKNMKVNCVNCQKEFEGSRKTLFCSPECNENYDESVGVEMMTTKTKISVSKNGITEKASDERLAKLKEVNDKINKDFGAGTIMVFGEKPNTEYQVVSTGSLGLDIALGIGGLPRGRIVEIFGWESSGKTTIALNVIANAQKQGLRCLLVDAENAFDPEYAESLGVRVEELEYCQPSCGEEGLEVADRKIMSGEIGVVVIDSVAALIPKAELEGQMGDNKMGLHARLMSQACRKMVSSISKNNTICIFINQFRHKIGVMYGSPEVTTGGNALQFYASIRMEVRRSTTEKNSVNNGDVKEGNQTTVKVVKNKCSPPFRSAQFNIMYGTGIDTTAEMIDIACDMKIIEKSGSWYSYNNSKMGQGKESIRQVLEDHPEIVIEIENKIRETLTK
jgi:recombination protein RecA